jgi:hypothetical protein
VGKGVLVVEKEGFVPSAVEVEIAENAVTVVEVVLTYPAPQKACGTMSEGG